METETAYCEELFKGRRIISLEKGQVLHRAGEPCRSMGMVVTGELRLARILSDGKELHIKTFRPGNLYAELIVFTGGAYPGWLSAAEATRVMEVELPAILEHLTKEENLISFMAGITGKMTQLSDMIEIQSLKTVRQKIAFALMYGEPGFSGDSSSVLPTTGFTVTQFARYIGCSREAVSRALSSMESDALIKREDGSIRIPDRTGLERILGD